MGIGRELCLRGDVPPTKFQPVCLAYFLQHFHRILGWRNVETTPPVFFFEIHFLKILTRALARKEDQSSKLPVSSGWGRKYFFLYVLVFALQCTFEICAVGCGCFVFLNYSFFLYF